MVNRSISANRGAPTDVSALEKTESILEDMFGESPHVRIREDHVDAEVDILGHRFLVEIKPSATTSAVSSAIEALKWAQQSQADHVVPLLVVPFMSGSSKVRCHDAGVSWLDLSGNAEIRDNELFILVEGKPNQYKTPGRPRNPFAAKSSRIVRKLLQEPRHPHTQKKLVEEANVSKALVSQVVNHLEDMELITRLENGSILVEDPALLIDQWRDNYSITDHQITKGHVYSAGQGPELISTLGKRFNELEVNFAFTGLSSAWHYAPFASFRTAAVFVQDPLRLVNSKELGFSVEPRGANVWVIQPNDESVFWDSEIYQDVRFTSPIQTLLDLKDHPERADDASIEMRSFLSRRW